MSDMIIRVFKKNAQLNVRAHIFACPGGFKALLGRDGNYYGQSCCSLWTQRARLGELLIAFSIFQ